MGDRLKRLLDKATAQVKRSGNQKSVKFSDEKNVLYIEKMADSADIDRLPVEKMSIVVTEKSKQISENENDEIKAYLSQLSSKTRPELDQNENKNENSEISDLSSLIIEREIERKRVSKYTPDQDNSKPPTALERLSHFEQKYLKSQPQKSHLLDTESEISFSDSNEDKKSKEIKNDEFDARNAAVLIDETDENVSQNEDISSILLDDLHFVDELPELISENEKSVEKSNQIDDNEEVESQISIIQTTSDVITAKTTNSRDSSTSSPLPTQSELEIDDQIESEQENSENSQNFLENVHFSVSESRPSSENQHHTPTPRPQPPPTRKIEPKPEVRPQKPPNSIATQTDLDVNPNLSLTIPFFGVQLDPYTCPSTLTNLLIKQGTLDALAATNPAILALNAMAKEQINFARTLFTARHHLYTQQMSSLQPDYHYTTWNDTIKDVARYRKKKMKKLNPK